MRAARLPPLAVVVTASLAAGACGGAVVPAREDLRRVEMDDLRAAGLSGSDCDEHGRLWAVAERDRYVYRLDGAGSDTPTAIRVPIEGVPEGLDLESMAWVADGRVAFGTEAQEPRDADLVLWADAPDGGPVRVTGTFELSWRELYGIEARENQGIEGLCLAGGILLAGGEPVIEDDGERFAPVARLDLRGEGSDRWEPFRVELTSAEGKLSSLDCSLAPDSDEIEVYAIERHYGVARVLRFEMPVDGPGDDLEPDVIVDLSDRLEHMPNMESLSWEAGRILILTDHDSTTEGGTTETILLGPLDDDD